MKWHDVVVWFKKLFKKEQITARVYSTSTADKVASLMAAAHNPSILDTSVFGNGNDFIAPLPKDESAVYLYNVSRTPARLTNGLIKNLTIPARAADKEVSTAVSIPKQYLEPVPQPGTDTIKIVVWNGDRVAADLLCPENYKDWKNLDWDEHNPKTCTQEGTNYYQRGCFWSLNKPPTVEEVAAAKARLQKTYAKSIAEIKAAAKAKESKILQYLGPLDKEAMEELHYTL